jgi:TonB family protein
MPLTLKTCGPCLLLLLLLTGSAWAQGSDSDRAAQQALNALRHREIPEATLPCTTEEREWWSKLRAAGEAVRKNMGSESDTRKFRKLLEQGQKEPYQPPIANRGATILHQVPFSSTAESRKKNISGSLALTVEMRADGTVGEVKIVQGLGHGLDESAMEAARQIVFLPAVKERKFVTVYMPMTMSLSSRVTYPWR